MMRAMREIRSLLLGVSGLIHWLDGVRTNHRHRSAEETSSSRWTAPSSASQPFRSNIKRPSSNIGAAGWRPTDREDERQVQDRVVDQFHQKDPARSGLPPVRHPRSRTTKSSRPRAAPAAQICAGARRPTFRPTGQFDITKWAALHLERRFGVSPRGRALYATTCRSATGRVPDGRRLCVRRRSCGASGATSRIRDGCPVPCTPMTCRLTRLSDAELRALLRRTPGRLQATRGLWLSYVALPRITRTRPTASRRGAAARSRRARRRKAKSRRSEARVRRLGHGTGR